MKRLRAAFITGILVLFPLFATINILLWLIQTIDNSIRQYLPPLVLPFDFKGLGLLVALMIIVLAGILTQNYVGQWMVSAFDGIVRRISFVGGIYSAIKKFLDTILSPHNEQFKGTVLVEFPRQGLYSIGFRTGIPDPKITQKEKKNLINVFVPCTPNPTSGFYLLVPENEVIALDMPVHEAFKIVVSMGIITSEDIPKLKK